MSDHAHKVEHAWVFVGTDPHCGGDAVPAFLGPHQTWYPLITTDESKLPALRKKARRIAFDANMPLRLLRLGNPEVVETITP